MDFTGSSLDVTVNALVGSMLLNGYIDDITNSILVTVENGDAARAATLQERVTEMVSGALNTDGLQASVISQTVSHNDELSALAQQYGISEGKAELIRKVVQLDPTLTFEALVGLSVNDISLIAASRSLTDSTVTQTGSASDKGYNRRGRGHCRRLRPRRGQRGGRQLLLCGLRQRERHHGIRGEVPRGERGVRVRRERARREP